MTAEANDPLEQQLQALRREYLADSALRVEELQGIRARLAAGEPAALAELRQGFHRLAGSGGSYGFPHVSSSAREGEQLTQGLLEGDRTPAAADLAALEACIERIGIAFEEAKRRLDGGPAAT